jgi:hypothetical protein
MSQYDINDPRNPNSPFNRFNVESPFYDPTLRNPGSGIFILLFVILFCKGCEWVHTGVGFFSPRVASESPDDMGTKVILVGILSAMVLLLSCVGIFWVKDFATRLIFGFLALLLVFGGLMILCPSLLN